MKAKETNILNTTPTRTRLFPSLNLHLARWCKQKHTGTRDPKPKPTWILIIEQLDTLGIKNGDGQEREREPF